MDQETKKVHQLKAQIIQGAAHPIRLAIIEYLGQEERCVADIVEHVGAQRSNVSRHLALMLNSGIVVSRKEGLNALYSLTTPCILQFLDCVNNVLRQRLEDGAVVLKKLD